MTSFLTRSLLASAIVSAALLTACGKADNPELDYVSEDLEECSRIEYTCPQFQEAFTNEDGCGCQPSDAPDDSENRTINNLMDLYLSKQVITKECDGEVFSDFSFIDNEATGSNIIKQNVWAIIGEFCPEGRELREGAFLSAPIVLNVEETGLSYIIRGHSLVEEGEDYESRLREVFTDEATDFILAGKQLERLPLLEERLRGNATLFFRLPLKSEEETSGEPKTSEEESGEEIDTGLIKS